MSPAGIETVLHGVRFRSRWSLMFDALGWRWEYEPIDLAGYIPDFVLMFPAGPVLVEVKPEFSVDALIESAAGKIREAEWWPGENRNSALLVGATWNPTSARVPHALTAGALRHLDETDSSSNYPGEWDGAMWTACVMCMRPTVVTEDLSDLCTVCGSECDERQFGGLNGHVGSPAFYDGALPDMEAVWRAAGDAVRWRRRSS